MQGDLFTGQPTLTQTDNKPQKNDFLDRHHLMIRLDQGIVGLISLLVLYVLVFSFGVEKGKRCAAEELRAERSKRERIMEEFRGNMLASTQVIARPEPKAPLAMTDAGYPQGKYAIQTVTVTSKATAEKEIKRLTDKGFQGFLIPSGKYLQVCVAGFETRAKASETLMKLKSEGLAPRDAYVRNIPSSNV